ncbi:MAG: DAK2 domain-containing protein [Eubacterium sp.]|nr:DAK2 domain-containing protein [Eubacterium sp.]
MSLTTIDAKSMQKAFISGANNISNNKEYINELNVFPVPDGDTGTNMSLTIMTAASEVEALQEPTIDLIAKAISGGSLRGARGNSGVILSQLFRGFCKDVKGKKSLGVEDLASGFARGVETAYKAVMKPKEGTILTVARGMSQKAADIIDVENDIILFLEQVIEHGEAVLAKTPDMLPVLKEAGVVDSGGQGLIEVMKGLLLGLKDEPVALLDAQPQKLARGAGVLEDIPKAKGSGKEDISTADIKFGYCTEFIILLEKELTDKQVEGIKEYLLSIGDSLVCVADEELVKIHVHTNHPGRAFEKGLEYGQLTRCKVDNMREEHSERVIMESEKQKAAEQEEAFKQLKAEKSAPKDKYGFIAISTGDGLTELFKEIGASYVVSGGQTMNPSTQDILDAADKVNAENVFILPNNSNIILAANQASAISKDKKIFVVPSKTIPQGIAALLSFNEAIEPEKNLEGMTAAMKDVKSGEITYAVRDTSIDGKEIHKDDIMGLADSGLASVGTDVDAVLDELVESLVDEDSGLISLYYGEDISEDKAGEVQARLSEKYEDLEVEIRSGGQPIYYYLLSVE